MTWFGKLLDDFRDSIAHTLRRFVSFSVLMFFFGSVFGVYVSGKAIQVGVPEPLWLLLIPLAISVLAYVSTEFAAFIFILMLWAFVLIFI